MLTRGRPTLILSVRAEVARRTTSNGRLLVISLRGVTTLRALNGRLDDVRILAGVSIRGLRAVLEDVVRRHVSNLTTSLATLDRETPTGDANVNDGLLSVVNR